MKKYRERRHKLADHDRTEKFRPGGPSPRRARRKYGGGKSGTRRLPPQPKPVTKL